MKMIYYFMILCIVGTIHCNEDDEILTSYQEDGIDEESERMDADDVSICSTCDTGFTTEPGCGFPGNDFKTATGVKTLEQCRSKCESLSPCKAFAFHKDTNICYLKSLIGHLACNKPVATGGRRCQLVQECRDPMCSTCSGGFTTEPGCGYPGNDSRVITDIKALETCRKRCSKLPACKGFGFHSDTNICYLKKRIGARVCTNPSITAGRRCDLVQECKDGNECATNTGCQGKPQCTNTYGYRTCTCKTGPSGVGFNCKDPMCTTCATGFTKEQGCGYAGNDFRYLTDVTSFERCRQTCANLPSCQAFTLNSDSNVCYLKGSIGKRKCSKPHTTAGRRCQLVQECKDPICSTCANGFTTEPGCGYLGNDLKYVTGVATVEDCQKKCAGSAPCKGFGFNKDSNICYLKSIIGKRSCTKPDVTSGRRCELVPEC